MKTYAMHPALSQGPALPRQTGRITMALIAVMLALGGCAGNRTIGGAPDLVVIPDQELPPPEAGDYSRNVDQHLLGPFDRIVIDVQALDGLQAREVQIDASGRFSLPWLGPVQAAGLSTAALEALLIERLRATHLRDPEVSVNLHDAQSRVVTFEGQVGKPGIYPLQGRTTLLQGIAQAGGTAGTADEDVVAIFRTVSGRRMVAIYSIDRIRLGQDKDPQIFPNDIVMVDANKARAMFVNVLGAIRDLSQPLLLIERLSENR